MKSAAWLVALFILTAASSAQEHPNLTAQPNSIYVGADGKFESAPDTAVIQFNISVQEDTSQAAYQHASKDAEQVREVLRANGIEPKSATIGFFSVQPMYDWKNARQRVIGYRVTTDVTLKLKDFSKIGPITQQLADANVSERQTLSYMLENVDEAKNKAVEDAYRRARNSAETLARASGRGLGELSYASVDTFENQRMPVPHMARAMAAMGNAAQPAPTEEFTPQNVTVTAHVNALFNLK
ncbi:MAG: SIMPL domain-containing protein [Candidatus Sulfotelmatobacter sp.]